MHDATHEGCTSTSSAWAMHVILCASLHACQLSLLEWSNDTFTICARLCIQHLLHQRHCLLYCCCKCTDSNSCSLACMNVLCFRFWFPSYVPYRFPLHSKWRFAALRRGRAQALLPVSGPWLPPSLHFSMPCRRTLSWRASCARKD